jgi:hypothetical protein
VILLALPLPAASLQVTKPEEVGLSADRLKRINELIDRRIAAGDISGAVTLVARRGRVVHFEAQGLIDIESKSPMRKDAIFRMASMSKPVTGVAIMMLVEEGKIRLTDQSLGTSPNSRLKVAGAATGARAGSRRRYAGRTTVLHGSGGSRDHHPRPAEPRLRPGERNHQHCRSGQGCAQRQ